MRVKIPRLLIAGAGSGSGKTTLSCGLLLALKKRGLKLAAFKCGPDYIDPMFQSQILGVKSRNLDVFMSGEEAVKNILAKNSQDCELAVLEGVMGLYDGQGSGDYASSNHLARLTGTPTLLLVNTHGQSLSLAAQVHGFLSFLPNNIKGVILNQTSKKMYVFFKAMLEERLGIRVYGYLPPLPNINFASRHLGLLKPAEIENLEQKLEILGEACEGCLEIEGLLELAQTAEDLGYAPPKLEVALGLEVSAGNPKLSADKSELTGKVKLAGVAKLTSKLEATTVAEAISKSKAVTAPKIKIAVAYDSAFCFYYEDNFEQLRALGASLEFFSPLEAATLPAGSSGLIIGGGYPEEHAAALAQNLPMLESIRAVGANGLPIFAECGGFMYLCQELSNKSGVSFPMVGLLKASCRMGTSLAPFGYITVTAEHDNFLCVKGAEFRAHEFHYSISDASGSACTARKADGRSWPCIHASPPAGGHDLAVGGTLASNAAGEFILDPYGGHDLAVGGSLASNAAGEFSLAPAGKHSSASSAGVAPAESFANKRRIFAGYPHFHFRGNSGLAEGFVRACIDYAKEVENG